MIDTQGKVRARKKRGNVYETTPTDMKLPTVQSQLNPAETGLPNQFRIHSLALCQLLHILYYKQNKCSRHTKNFYRTEITWLKT